MRIAHFAAAGKGSAHSIIELEVGGGGRPEIVATTTGDPLVGVPINYTGARYGLVDARLLAPVIPRSRIVATGRSYADHTAEQGAPVPGEPMLFTEPNTCVIGPNESIMRPERYKGLHHEDELAIVIGRIYKQVPTRRTAEVVFGYTIANDVIARDWQWKDDQWSRAKGCDAFCPLGPRINTYFTLAEVGHLAIKTRVGEEMRQQGNTSQLVRGVPEPVTYISPFTILLPGGVVLTGTLAGVGLMTDRDAASMEADRFGMLSSPMTVT